jgi:hypothetical protein
MKKRLTLLSVEREPRAAGPALTVVSLQKQAARPEGQRRP